MSFQPITSHPPLQVVVDPSDGSCEINSQDMDLVGQVFQDLVNFMNIDDLPSIAHFKEELDAFQKTLDHLGHYKS